jgi:parallel beta-helix repeat protein
MSERPSIILFLIVVCLAGVALAIAQPPLITSDGVAENITRIDASSDSCRNRTAPFVIAGRVTYINDEPISNLTVSITNLNTTENFEVRTNATSNYYRTLTISTNVSAGDRIRFNASNGMTSNESIHNIITGDIGYGGFVRNLKIEFAEPYPDLKITNCSVNVVDPENKTLNITYTVENAGTANAGESNTTIHIDGIPASGDPVGSLEEWGGNHTSTVGPLDFPHNSPWIKVCADSGGAVDEFSEANNCNETKLECPLPDLVINPDAPEQLLRFVDSPNGRYIIRYYVINRGGADCESTNVTATITTAATDDSLVSHVIINNSYGELQREGGNYHETTLGPFTCSCNQTVQYSVCADADKNILESNEANNCQNHTFVCPATGKPDLTITDHSETWINRTNRIFEINYTVENIGQRNAESSTTYIKNSGYDCTEEAFDRVPALAPGESYNNTAGPFRLCGPPDCSGRFRTTIKICADNDDEVNESNEINNRIGYGFALPHLMFRDAYARWDSNKTFVIDYTVYNDEHVKSNKTALYVYLDGERRNVTGTIPQLECHRVNYRYHEGTVGSFEMVNETVKYQLCIDRGDGVDTCIGTTFGGSSCVAEDNWHFTCGGGVHDPRSDEQPLAINKSCKLNGDMYCPCGLEIAADDIVIDGNGTFGIFGKRVGCAERLEYHYQKRSGIRNHGRDNVTLKNLNIRNFCNGIGIAYTDDNRIENCSVHDNGAEDRYTYGITIVNSCNITIDNCRVYNSTGGVYPEDDGTVCGGHGINFDDGVGDGSSYCSVMNSSIFHNYHSGIYAPSTCKYLNITGNRIGDNGYCGGLMDLCAGINLDWKIGHDRTTNSAVSKNMVRNNTGSGIRVAQGYTTIIDNIVSGCKNGTNVVGDGILIDGGWVTFLYNNTVCDNEGTDIIDTANESSTFGDDNICDTTDKYSDEGTRGCIFYCGGANGICVGENYNFSCGMVVNESCIFNRSMNCPSNGGLIAGADDIVINGSGCTIIGNSTGIGIFSNQTNVTIKNLQVKDFSTGIAIENTRSSTIENCNLRKNLRSGINFTADHGTVRNSRIYDNLGDGIVVGGSYNIFLNNTVVRNMGYGIYFSPYATNNTINASAIGDNDAGDIFNGENSTNRTNSGYENTCDITHEYGDCSPMGMIYGCTYPWTPPDLIITWKREEWVNHTEKRYNISYRIKNERDRAREAYPSRTYLHIDDKYLCIAEDQVDTLGPGYTQHKTFEYVHEMSDDDDRDRIWVCADGADDVLENNAADIFYHKIGFGNYTVKELWVDHETNNCRLNTQEYECVYTPDESAACVADDGTVYRCGDTVMKSCTFNGKDMGCPAGPGLIIGADDIMIDGNGSKIIGSVTCADCEYASEEAPCEASGIYNAGYDNVTIKGLEVVGFCTGIALKGVSGDPVGDNLIEGCKIHDNGFDTGSETKTHGIHLCYVSETTIKDNEIYRNKGTGSFCDGGGNGIFIYAGGSSYDDNIITGNVLRDNDKAGLWGKRGMQNNEITHNTISGNGNGPGITDDVKGGIVLRCGTSNYNTITDNTVNENYGDGMFIGSGENTISHNTVNDNTMNGIDMGRSDGSHNNKLYENTVCGNEGRDISVYGSGSGTTGDENTCDTTSREYKDTNAINSTGCTYRCGKMPDFIISDVTAEWVNPDDPEAGYKIAYTIENIGNADASNITVRSYVDGNPKHDMIISELAAEESRAVTAPDTLTMSEETCVKIRVCADPDDDGDSIPEFDEDNNCLMDEWCALPDLIVTRIDVPDEISMILPNNARATVANIGTVETKGAFDVALFVNNDHADTVAVKPNLVVGENITVQIIWTSALESNELMVFADSGDVIEESDETNNSKTILVGENGNGTGNGTPGTNPNIHPETGIPIDDLIQPGEVDPGEGVGGNWNYDETIGNESVSGRAAKERVSAQLFRSNPFFGAVKEVVVSHSGITVVIALFIALLFYVGFHGELTTHRRNNR